MTNMKKNIYKGCSESNAPHFFLGNYLFRMYEIPAQYNWMCSFTHVLFPHNLHLRLWSYASAKQGYAYAFDVPARFMFM